MAKIHPNRSVSNSSSSSSSSSSCLERETFTVWMKSLVFHGNGCTVFNSRGEVVFRVDNYQKKSSSEVFLMDSRGKTLFSLYKKKLRVFSCWEGFKSGEREKPWFQVRRDHSFMSKDFSCRVMLENGTSYCRIIGLEGKSSLKIIDCSGQLLAEATEKLSAEGIPLGKDVVRLIVEPHADPTFMIALLTIYGLITNTL